MCLILVAWRTDAKNSFVVAANRDEIHARASAAAAFWNDDRQVLAGRDLEAGGTWLGITRSGRFAAVTNVRGGQDPNARESRGLLTKQFLQSTVAPRDYVEAIAARGAVHSGYNLLVADADELWWHSNRNGAPRRLEAGVYGLGNESLDSGDVAAAKRRFSEALSPAPATEALHTALAPSRIVNGAYGTRCSSTLVATAGRLRFSERSFDALGAELATVHFDFTLAVGGVG